MPRFSNFGGLGLLRWQVRTVELAMAKAYARPIDLRVVSEL